jgi:hypothetical protein
MSRDSSVGIATSYELDGRGSIPGKGKDFSLFHKVQTALEPHYAVGIRGSTQGYSGRGVKLTTHLHLVPRSRMMQLYLYSPVRLHDMVLN